MMLQTVILAVALVTISGPVTAKVYSQCQLATLLTKNGITTNIPDWVCLIMGESEGNTAAIGGSNYGIFQISTKWWCGMNGPGGDCNIACSKLLDDDITDDIACAKLIYAEQGFKAWTAWVNNCKNPPAVCPC